MASTTPYLLQLPPELLLGISDFLPPDGILALKLTHPVLNSILLALPPSKNHKLDPCARFAIERLRTPPNEDRHQLRCILCKDMYPMAMFSSSSSPACLPLAFEPDAPRPQVVDLPPSFCAWHVARLARVIRTEAGGRNEWVSDVARMCMHKGCIEGWHECNCECSSCGHRIVRTYTRYVNYEPQSKKFHFWRNTAAGANENPQEKIAGRLYVQEKCWNPSEFYLIGAGATPEKSIIQMPVYYEDVARSDHGIMRNHTEAGRPTRLTGRMSIDIEKYTTAVEFPCSMPP